MKESLRGWAQLIGIGALLIAGAIVAWLVFGSIPPGCHNKIDSGFCVTRHKKFNEGIPGQRTEAPHGVRFLVSAAGH